MSSSTPGANHSIITFNSFVYQNGTFWVYLRVLFGKTSTRENIHRIYFVSHIFGAFFFQNTPKYTKNELQIYPSILPNTYEYTWITPKIYHIYTDYAKYSDKKADRIVKWSELIPLAVGSLVYFSLSLPAVRRSVPLCTLPGLLSMALPRRRREGNALWRCWMYWISLWKWRAATDPRRVHVATRVFDSTSAIPAPCFISVT